MEYQHQYLGQSSDDHKEPSGMVHTIWERYAMLFKNERNEVKIFPTSLVSCPKNEWMAVIVFTSEDIELIMELFPEKYRTGKEYRNDMELHGVPLGFKKGNKQDALDGLADLILEALVKIWK